MTGNQWLIFDYGEVISSRTAALPALAQRIGVPASEFEPAYWAARNAYDRGCTDLDYWRAVGQRVGVGVDRATSNDLTELDILGWSRTEQSTLDLLDTLSEAGSRMALLSNAPVSFARFAERQEWTRHFRELVFSGDLRMAKPDRAIFDVLVSRIGARPQDCLFVDDRQSNIDGAREAGLRAERWTGAESALAFLRPA
ncbi:putative hydrolase of the HAD superfamily [Amycolatopsis marina]|uniref:Putative hydrolase of the HAD superfamily n=1 Tax=Amycolatopsis marina TaxID=490629 RepID=A0A1I0VHH5_9PSEU|nr:HAD family phosphatase [Amycolatopsis marina]SFA75949.1 putative hydrolase of the HAD superfamily [Amycolatopsis marina]